VIANPAAGRGEAKNDFSLIRSAFASVGVLNFCATEVAGDEEKLAGAAIASGAETIIAVGGDGTCARVADAILKSGAFVPVRSGADRNRERLRQGTWRWNSAGTRDRAASKTRHRYPNRRGSC